LDLPWYAEVTTVDDTAHSSSAEGDGQARPAPRSLFWAALADFAVAAALAVTFFVAAPAYSFFGVEFLAELAAAGSTLPGITSGGLAILGLVAGIYALSGAGYLRRLPLLKTVLALATIAFLARGAWIAFELARVMHDYRAVRYRELWLSAAALGIGFLHLTGLRHISLRDWGE
jgi:hypothetical protein